MNDVWVRKCVKKLKIPTSSLMLPVYLGLSMCHIALDDTLDPVYLFNVIQTICQLCVVFVII